jgi:hypothetical protein
VRHPSSFGNHIHQIASIARAEHTTLVGWQGVAAAGLVGAVIVVDTCPVDRGGGGREEGKTAAADSAQ